MTTPPPDTAMIDRDLDLMRGKWLVAVAAEDRAAEWVLMARLNRLLERRTERRA